MKHQLKIQLPDYYISFMLVEGKAIQGASDSDDPAGTFGTRVVDPNPECLIPDLE